ncbi:hypothetical protein KAM644c_15910 [Klebsiella quasipneumoniae subsp. quasipneumoniae]|uniref:Uncharacterized protein n=1 Tax=Klebsiella quasipneumoniae subsp. quasipneumoniae TaxID=1667327 RepID=A0AAN1Y4C9_9ENTR|nr:hypothetical protein [Klebsiella quasipneumoniae]HDZ9039137.1 hypothetical protein [Klebsiella pneumoniae]BDO02034.1 hypothetical protein KAM622c_16210 [Klebsiella quasipneumoniae subsp. quasipneumoniae]BDO12525.1 hypothetical protein KAM644c_15910 [Klebsiella quasipneumoniae subsp. quasipneumoniae]BDO18498.1 hypothetical protein KAM645c_15880 [Klebsiella quasipneumoniae subsp. quasipneumoniae]HBR1854240.1 hypothetical protein [Klebsiella quasipneumoniae subsp. quasipneumoniae]
MSQTDRYPYHQNFVFHLTDAKFMRGVIEYHSPDSFGALLSDITDIATPLPNTFVHRIICEANTTAIMAFEEIVRLVQKESEDSQLQLCLVVNEDLPKHLGVDVQKLVLNRYYNTPEIPVQPFV